MKNLNFLKWMMGSVLTLSVFLTACGRSNSSDNSLRGTGVVALADTCSTGASAIGMIFNDGTMNFQNQVAQYVSSWMSPNDLGTVDGNPGSSQTGIDLKGKLKFDGAGQVVVATTGMEITIYDSFKAQGRPGIAPANYNQKAVSGNMNASTRQFNVTFQDTYGQVNISGQYDNNFAWGYVKFNNTRAVSGYSPQSGTLGAFKISKCGLLD